MSLRIQAADVSEQKDGQLQKIFCKNDVFALAKDDKQSQVDLKLLRLACATVVGPSFND